MPWAAYDPGIKQTMVFDTQSGSQNNPDGDLLALMPPGNAR